MEELLVAALVGILVSWFILDQSEAQKAPEPPAVEQGGGAGSTPPGPEIQPQTKSGA